MANTNEYRRGYEFGNQTKRKVIKESGLKGEVHVHHIISIAELRRRKISPRLGQSRINARALTREEHIKAHSGPYRGYAEEDGWLLDEMLELTKDCDDL